MLRATRRGDGERTRGDGRAGGLEDGAASDESGGAEGGGEHGFWETATSKGRRRDDDGLRDEPGHAREVSQSVTKSPAVTGSSGAGRRDDVGLLALCWAGKGRRGG